MVIRDGHSVVTSHLCGSLGHATAGVRAENVLHGACLCVYEPVGVPHCVHRDQETSLGVGTCLPT